MTNPAPREVAEPMAEKRPDGKALKPLPGYFAIYYQCLAKRALELGYALAVHGTMARDLDLIAVPWFDWSVSNEAFVEAIREHVSGEIVEHPSPDVERQGGLRPHGRRVWSIQLGGGPYIDLSVMPTSNPVASLRSRVEAMEAAIQRALADSESGNGWGPDVTVCAYLRAAIDARGENHSRD